MCPQVPDEMARYKQLLFLAAKLPAMPKEEHVDENKVKGCVSQVWRWHAAGPMHEHVACMLHACCMHSSFSVGSDHQVTKCRCGW